MPLYRNEQGPADILECIRTSAISGVRNCITGSLWSRKTMTTPEGKHVLNSARLRRRAGRQPLQGPSFK